MPFWSRTPAEPAADEKAAAQDQGAAANQQQQAGAARGENKEQREHLINVNEARSDREEKRGAAPNGRLAEAPRPARPLRPEDAILPTTPEDDAASQPGVQEIDKLLASEREQKRKEDERRRERARQYEDTEYPFADSLRARSPEKWTSTYLLMMATGVFVLWSSGFFILTKDYDKRPCFKNDVLDICMLRTANQTCININANEPIGGADCVEECAKFTTRSNVGCRVVRAARSTDPDTVVCEEAAEFSRLCTDSATCPDDVALNINVPLRAFLVMLFVHLTLMLLWGVALSSISSYHDDDFRRAQTCMSRLAIIIAKNCGWALQLVTLIEFFMVVYLVGEFLNNRINCPYALTTTGTRYKYVTYVGMYLVAVVAYLASNLLLGTWFRLSCPVRGQIYRPSFDEEIRVPCGADCRKQRARNRPRVCPETFADIKAGLPCCRPCVYVCECFTDTVFCLSCMPVGFLLERFYKYRHFIGP